jgi:hypothetical protein
MKDGAMLKRGEWETSLERDQLSLDALPKAARRLIPKAVRERDLITIFETKYRRQTRRLAIDAPGGSAIIEAALDQGVIEALGNVLPIAEIELERLDGEATSPYQLALALLEELPPGNETRSKSNRADDAITGGPPSWRRAVTPCLTPDDTVARTLLHSLLANPGTEEMHRSAGTVIGWHARGVFDLEPRLASDWSSFARREPFWT